MSREGKWVVIDVLIFVNLKKGVDGSLKGVNNGNV